MLDMQQVIEYICFMATRVDLGDKTMGQKEFDLILDNIDKLKTAVEEFPAAIQETVYSSMIAALLKNCSPLDEASKYVVKQGIKDANSSDVDACDVAEELEQYYMRYSLDSASDMEFAAFLGYFYAKLAPPSDMVERINENHYRMACMITGRSLPGRISGTMNNAKNHKGYLESHGSGVYSITTVGEHYVKHRLLKEDD